MSETSKIAKELSRIQQALKVPKSKTNKFGGYKYRSCEDIFEAVKPHLKECGLMVTDDVVCIGDRIYFKARAILRLGSESIHVDAFAREPESKKGMDVAQVSGTSSSYARKYALNGMFLCDDTQDSDTGSHPDESKPAPSRTPDPTAKKSYSTPSTDNMVSAAQLKAIGAAFTCADITDRHDKLKFVSSLIRREIPSSKDLTKREASMVIDELNSINKAREQ